MTFDEYDAMMERFDSEKMKSLKPCWPPHKFFTTQILAHPEDNIPVCCYLLEKVKTKNLEEENIRFQIQEFVYQNLELYDPEDER